MSGHGELWILSGDGRDRTYMILGDIELLQDDRPLDLANGTPVETYQESFTELGLNFVRAVASKLIELRVSGRLEITVYLKSIRIMRRFSDWPIYFSELDNLVLDVARQICSSEESEFTPYIGEDILDETDQGFCLVRLVSPEQLTYLKQATLDLGYSLHKVAESTQSRGLDQPYVRSVVEVRGNADLRSLDNRVRALEVFYLRVREVELVEEARLVRQRRLLYSS